MFSTQQPASNCEVGKFYRLQVLCYEGRRPYAIGDIVYCERVIGNTGTSQMSLVKIGPGQQIRRVPGSIFAMDRPLSEVGALSKDKR
jgi:hypothetical protein